MRHWVTVEQQATTQDAVGQQTQTWTTITKRMAEIQPLNGREFFAASGEHSEVTTRIRMRYDDVTNAINAYDRITHGSDTYDILSVINVDKRNHELVLMCKLRA